MTGEITVFSGSAHPAFARDMCRVLGVEVSPSRTSRSSNDCVQVQLRGNFRRRDLYVVQPLVPPVRENLFELLLMLDAARGASAAHITAVIPPFAYARSDKKDAPRISNESRLPNLVVRSVAPFAETVHRIHHGEPVSSLFSDVETYG